MDPMENSRKSPIQTDDISPPCGPRTRRRLIQSTLFPSKTPEKSLDEERLNEEEDHQACQTLSPYNGSKRKTKTRKTEQGTPEKNLRKVTSPGAVKENCIKVSQESQTKSTSACSEQTLNLRLEAKFAAEEDARLSAGRPIHPFFVARRLKKNIENFVRITCPEDEGHASNGDPVYFCPIHVFQKTEEDEIGSFSWKDWTISESTIVKSDRISFSYPSSLYYSILEGSQKPLEIDNWTDDSSYCSILPTEMGLHENLTDTQGGDLCAGFEQFLASVNQVKNGRSPMLVCSINGGNEQKQDDHFQESRVHGSLWTDKYQPENSMEVCGNSEAVKSLGEWLQCWCGKAAQFSEESGEDVEEKWPFFGSDTECDEAPAARNVMLVTGPVGSGKSAAIYACAKEQGFQIIEINASDCRNGSILKQRFQEAMESHRVNKWTHGNQNPVLPIISSSQKSRLLSVAEGIATSIACVEPIMDEDRLSKNRIGLLQLKTLILFEDVDSIFEEDRGFTSTLLHLAKTTKRPMVLTSNSKDPCLPHLMERLVIDFTHPSSAELLSGLSMVCTIEKLPISLHLMERFVQCFGSDIRKTIINLQFWCQGNQNCDASRRLCTYRPLPFDICAAHLFLPKLVPWDFPCQLSVIIEKEISNSMKYEGYMELHDPETCNNNDLIGTKKDAILTKFADETDYGCSLPFSYVPEIFDDESNSACSSHEARKRMRNSIISSDSEEDVIDVQLEVPSLDHNSQPLSLVSDSVQSRRRKLCITCSSDSAEILSPVVGCSLQCPSGALLPEAPSIGTRQESQGNSYLNVYNNDEKAILNSEQDCLSNPEHIEERRCHESHCSYTVPCVVEASFVAESETWKEEQYASRVKCSIPDDTSYNQPSTSSLGCDVDKRKAESIMSSKRDTGYVGSIEARACRDESQEYVLSNEEAAVVGPQVLDQCSRMDFHAASKEGRLQGFVESNSVQKTWKKIRACEDLKDYMGPNLKKGLVVAKLSSSLTNLLSDAEILFSCCQLLTDMSDPSLIPFKESEYVCCSDNQLEYTSTFAEHGFCFYARTSVQIGKALGCHGDLDLAGGMLASSRNSMAIGKLVAGEIDPCQNRFLMQGQGLRNHVSVQRKKEAELCRGIMPLLPDKLHLSVKSTAFVDYLSFLSHISKYETLRISKGANGRLRCNRHYLCSWPNSLSSEDINLLSQYGCFE